MARKLTTQDFSVLRALYESERGLAPYSLYKKCYLSPAVLAHIVNKLSALGLAETSQPQIRLTETGEGFLRRNFPAMFAKVKQWKAVPSEFLGPRIEVDAPYVPRRTKLHSSFKR